MGVGETCYLRLEQGNVTCLNSGKNPERPKVALEGKSGSWEQPGHMPPTLSPEAHLYFAAGFLSLDTVDIVGCIILCSRDYSVHCRIFSRSNHWMPVAHPPYHHQL